MTESEPMGLVRSIPITRKIADDYRKDTATVESDLPSGMDALEGLDTLTRTLEAHLNLAGKPGLAFPAAQSPSQPQVLQPASAGDPQIPQQGWTDFQSGKGSWIKSEVAPQLRYVLSRAEGKTVVVGAYRYKLSGDSGQFINRFSHTRGSSK